eukprot:scaffold1376_cov125-Cylindrotheca_fusiformis.AAC.1
MESHSTCPNKGESCKSSVLCSCTRRRTSTGWLTARCTIMTDIVLFGSTINSSYNLASINLSSIAIE